MKKPIVRILLVLLGVLAVLLVIFSFMLGPMVKTGVETIGPEVTKVALKLEKADVSLLGNAELSGFLLGNPPGFKTDAAVKVGAVKAKINPFSLLGNKVVVRSLSVASPEITLEGGLLTQNNLLKIKENIEASLGGAKGAEKPEGVAEPEGKGTLLQIDDLLITDAKVTVKSIATAGQELTIPLPEIHLANLGAGPEGITPGEVADKIIVAVLGGAKPALTKEAAKLEAAERKKKEEEGGTTGEETKE